MFSVFKDKFNCVLDAIGSIIIGKITDGSNGDVADDHYHHYLVSTGCSVIVFVCKN